MHAGKSERVDVGQGWACVGVQHTLSRHPGKRADRCAFKVVVVISPPEGIARIGFHLSLSLARGLSVCDMRSARQQGHPARRTAQSNRGSVNQSVSTTRPKHVQWCVVFSVQNTA